MIFFCLESARDVISAASLLITVIGVVCMGSHSEEGCGCALEVELSIKQTSALVLSTDAFPLLLTRKESPLAQLMWG